MRSGSAPRSRACARGSGRCGDSRMAPPGPGAVRPRRARAASSARPGETLGRGRSGSPDRARARAARACGLALPGAASRPRVWATRCVTVPLAHRRWASASARVRLACADACSPRRRPRCGPAREALHLGVDLLARGPPRASTCAAAASATAVTCWARSQPRLRPLGGGLRLLEAGPLGLSSSARSLSWWGASRSATAASARTTAASWTAPASERSRWAASAASARHWAASARACATASSLVRVAAEVIMAACSAASRHMTRRRSGRPRARSGPWPWMRWASPCSPAASSWRRWASSRRCAASTRAASRSASDSSRAGRHGAVPRSRMLWVCRVTSTDGRPGRPSRAESGGRATRSGMAHMITDSASVLFLKPRRPRVGTWSAGSSGSRTSTASPARSTGSAGSRRTRLPRYLFRKVVSWGRSSNVFLSNGSRLYLDVGSTPSTRPGVRPRAPARRARQGGGADPRGPGGRRAGAARRGGVQGRSTSSRTTPTRPATPTAATRTTSWAGGRVPAALRRADPVPVSRQITCGRGKVVTTSKGATYCVSQRADHIWEGCLLRHNPLPADHQHPRRAARRRGALPAPARHRGRLQHERDHDHAQGGLVRPGAAHDRGRVVMRDLTLENPIRAIREMSHDMSGRKTCACTTARAVRAADPR